LQHEKRTILHANICGALIVTKETGSGLWVCTAEATEREPEMEIEKRGGKSALARGWAIS
jgi:hypothetical protein